MAGAVAIFVCTLAFSWVFGLAVAAHASHYFLSIVESSATATARNISWKGQRFREWIRDGINWPDDTLLDYFAKTFYFGYMVFLWAGPAILISRLAVESPHWRTAVAGGIFWLMFPIGQLSSLMSDSRWNPFWTGVIEGYLKRPVKTFAFYVMSAPVLAVIFLLFDLLFVRISGLSTAWAIALAPIAVAAFFVYARLIGRLGMVLAFAMPREKPEKKTKARPKRRRPMEKYDEKTRWAVPKDLSTDTSSADAQPNEMPGLQTPYDGVVTGYGIDYEGKPIVEESPPVRKVFKFDDEDDLPITVEPPPDLRNTDRERIAAEMAEPPEHEVALYLRERPKEPTNPYGAESVTFLFDLKTIDPWLRLTFGLIGLALLLRFLETVRPPLE